MAWLGVVAWMIVVAVVSVAPVSGPAVELPLGADKWAHAAFYAVLGLLAARAAWRSGAPVFAAWTIAFALATAYGAGMEWIQGHVGRDPSLADGFADALGAAIGAGVPMLYVYSTRSEGTR